MTRNQVYRLLLAGERYSIVDMCLEETLPFGKTPISGLPESFLVDILLCCGSHVLGGNRRRYPTSFLLLYYFLLLFEPFLYPSFQNGERKCLLVWQGYLVENTCAFKDIVAAHLCLLCFFHGSRMVLVGIGGTDETQLGTWQDENEGVKLNIFFRKRHVNYIKSSFDS